MNIRAFRNTAIAILLALVLGGCAGGTGTANSEPAAETKTEAEASSGSYQQITQEEAKAMREEQSDYLIVDVRRPDEFAEGHIAGAINVPNETIGEEAAEALPDKDQYLFIYCRSGRRSKEASQVLADLGYTNVYEFGGIIDWTGEIETD